MTLRQLRRPGLVLVAALAALLGTVSVPAAMAAPAGTQEGTYVNPVSREFADTYADPAVVRGRDGWWYAYATTDPLRSGEGVFHRIPMSRSRDLVDWDYIGDAFGQGAAGLPSWGAPDAALWAPDVRYVAGRWVIYYVVTQTTVTDEPERQRDRGGDRADADRAVDRRRRLPRSSDRGRGGAGNPGRLPVDLRPGAPGHCDGRQYLYYGSYYGGVFAVELSADGTRAVGDADDGRDRQPVRGHVRRAAERLVLLVRLVQQLLRRPGDRLQRLRRPVPQPARTVRRSGRGSR